MRELAPANFTAGAIPLLADVLPSFAPPPKLSSAEWAEENIILPKKTNAEGGKLKLARYQRLALDKITHPGVRRAVLMWASQTGKSLTIDTLMLDRIMRDPGPMLHMTYSDDTAKNFVKERLDPLVAESPNLRGIFGTGKQGNDGDGLHFKDFPNGFLVTVGSHKAVDLRSRPIRYLWLDELDAYPTSAGKEGSPDKLIMVRQRTFKKSETDYAIISSTPTDRNSRIMKYFEDGDRSRYFVPCPCCGTMDHLHWDRFHYEADDYDSAYLSCDHCDHHITEAERMEALQHGEWRATAEGSPGVVSLHANVLISEFLTLALIAQEAEASQGSPADRRTFMNTSRCEIYEPDGAQLDAFDLQERAIPLSAPYPKDIQFITSATDVQGNRVETQIVGHGYSGDKYVLNYHVHPGDTMGVEPWRQLDDLMGKTYPTVDGRNLIVAAQGIDCGYRPDPVYRYVAEQRAKGRLANPLFGRDGWGRRALQGTSNKTPYGHTIYMVGVDPLKERIVDMLSGTSVDAGNVHIAAHLDSRYFEGLTKEKLVEKIVRGRIKLAWENKAGNESLDTLGYALAIADRVPRFLREPGTTKRRDYSLNHLHVVKG